MPLSRTWTRCSATSHHRLRHTASHNGTTHSGVLSHVREVRHEVAGAEGGGEDKTQLASEQMGAEGDADVAVDFVCRGLQWASWAV